MSLVGKNRYKVVFRDSTVVMDRIIHARTMVGAAKKAIKLTDPRGEFADWSVYSITPDLIRGSGPCGTSSSGRAAGFQPAGARFESGVPLVAGI